ncbi:MAG TPA: Gfo/Idh/MocA family oxidoreductase [Candidatus Dormibacteraeota bacterium]|nr:Gfo/Idh/MocA family oxidoreductase [Candidatus Dormibacteraeota bacterium]
MARLPIAVVGTDFGARIQVPALAASGRFEVVALVGRRREHTAALAARLGVPRAPATLEEALAIPGLRAVSVATPPDTHAEYAIAAAAAGVHVLCEKPMARTAAEARAMLAAVRAAGVVGMIDHEFRFDPSRAMLSRLLRAGALGAPRLVTGLAMSPLFADPYRPAPAWWFDAARGGGWLGASGSHLIDAVREWVGEIDAVAALVDTFQLERRVAGATAATSSTADDTFSLLLRLACGAEGMMQQSAVSWGPRLTMARIAGAEGTAWIDERGQLWRAGPKLQAAPVEVDTDLALPQIDIPSDSGPFARWELPAFVRMAERFADAIEGKPIVFPAAATFADGVAVQSVMEAARAASRERRWVSVREVWRV